MITAEPDDEHRIEVRRLIARQPEGLELLNRVCLAAAEALCASGAGISVMTADGTRGVTAASDPVSERVEELQFTLGEGPCIDAFTDRRPVLTSDLADAEKYRWPIYAPAARSDGVRAVFAFPLQIGAVQLGVMDVFRDRTGPLTAAQLSTAFSFVAVTIEALLERQQNSLTGASDDDAILEVGHRATIFQAQGMVMVQLGVPIDEALVRMRAYAFAENRRLVDVARDLVDRRLRLNGNTDDTNTEDLNTE